MVVLVGIVAASVKRMENSPIDAVFENGMFRPLDPVHVPVCDGQQVRLHIEQSAIPTSLEQACQVYDGLSPDQISEIERIALQGNEFFIPG